MNSTLKLCVILILLFLYYSFVTCQRTFDFEITVQSQAIYVLPKCPVGYKRIGTKCVETVSP